MRIRARTIWPLLVVALTGIATGCASGPTGSAGTATVRIVAAENFWGSLAGQLAGNRGQVLSILTDPNADPHEYESSPVDARAFATAQLVIVNGAGYDSWAQKLLDANPVPGRHVLTVATLLGKRDGDNPHFWYSPAYVHTVIGALTRELERVDASQASYFAQQRALLEARLQPYDDRVADIKRRFAGVKVGATETIFGYLADALGLNLASPPQFMQAVAEGSDPPAGSVATFEQQVAQKQIRVLVYNAQTATLVTTNIRSLAAAHEVPVVGISETLQPSSSTFQAWQLGQLNELERALSARA